MSVLEKMQADDHFHNELGYSYENVAQNIMKAGLQEDKELLAIVQDNEAKCHAYVTSKQKEAADFEIAKKLSELNVKDKEADKPEAKDDKLKFNSEITDLDDALFWIIYA